eukprot:TRINITY_DN12510_c0_g1_i1.p1 TRINITY_DN12510_c0_g1~~TRINITY_DN12510_c0_g1_i1.p1  ORF type:complete len:520 (+),score=122.00 TRINITY_DN12510_c0_g1_i1:55-1560(+)
MSACLACATTLDKSLFCARCRTATYCSPQCQRSHWPTHKPVCVPATGAAKPAADSVAPKPSTAPKVAAAALAVPTPAPAAPAGVPPTEARQSRIGLDRMLKAESLLLDVESQLMRSAPKVVAPVVQEDFSALPFTLSEIDYMATLGNRHASLKPGPGRINNLEQICSTVKCILFEEPSEAQQRLMNVVPDFARILLELGDRIPAEASWRDPLVLYRAALALVVKAFGLETEDASVCIDKIGLLLVRQSNHAAALVAFQRALSILARNPGKCEALSLGMELCNVGTMHLALGSDDLALDFMRRALNVLVKVGQPWKVTLIAALEHLSVSLQKMNEFDGAVVAARRLVEIKLVEEDKKGYFLALQRLYACYTSAKQTHLALPIFRQCAEAKAALGEPGIGEFFQECAKSHNEFGQKKEALALYKKSLLYMKKEYGNKPNQKYAAIYMELSILEMILGDKAASEKYSKKAVQMCDNVGNSQGTTEAEKDDARRRAYLMLFDRTS